MNFSSRAFVAALVLVILSTATATANPGGTSPIGSVQPAQRHSFSLFATAPEQLPRNISRFFAENPGGLGSASLRLNLDLAQRVRPSRDLGPLWVIPGAGSICIFSEGRTGPGSIGGSTCASTLRVVRGGLDLSRSRRTIGLVPDRVDAVRLKGNPEPVAVAGNVFAGKGDGLVKLIRRRNPDDNVPWPSSPDCPPAADGSPQYCPVARSGLASRPSGRLVLVSRQAGGNGKPSVAATSGGLSADGRFAAYAAEGEIFLRDIRTGRTRLIGEGGGPTLSANARFLAYDNDGKVFVSDLRTGTSSLASRPLPDLLSDVAGSGYSSSPSISADGRYVAFASSVRGLVDEDGDRRPDHDYPPEQVYLRDLETGTTTLISRGSGPHGPIGDFESKQPAISANGRYVAFSSRAGNLLPGAPRGRSGVYVRDLATGRLRRASHWHSKPGSHRSEASMPSISANGRYVAFKFDRFGGPSSVVVRDLRTGAILNASLLTRNPLKPALGALTISANGRFVAFRADPTKGGLERLYLVDLRTRRTRFVHSVSTGEAGVVGGPLSFSANSRFLLFDTYIDANAPKGTEPLIPAQGEVYRYSNPFLP